MTEAYAGIDVAFAKGKRLPISVCMWQDGRLVPLPLRQRTQKPPIGRGNPATLNPVAVQEFAREALAYLRTVERTEHLRIRMVAIDAPSAAKRADLNRRYAECAMDERRISCFATPSETEFETILCRARQHLSCGGAISRLPHANQLWMLVGFQLFITLGEVYECIEVFPQATVSALGIAAPHKTKSGGLVAQQQAVSHLTGWPEDRLGEPRLEDIGYGSRHDKLDAYLSAWVAALPALQREACGVPPNDVIWVPRLGQPLAKR